MEYKLLRGIFYHDEFYDFTLEELWLEYYKNYIKDFFKAEDEGFTPKDYIEKYLLDKEENFRVYFDDKFNEFLENEIDSFIRTNPDDMFYGFNRNGFVDKMKLTNNEIYKVIKNESSIRNINDFFKYEFLDKNKVIEYYNLAYLK